MKQATGTYSETSLQEQRHHIILYKVALKSGVTYYFSSSGEDITATIQVDQNGTTETHQFVAIGSKQEKAKVSADVSVDQLTVTVPNVPLQYNAQQVLVGTLALGGVFDNATVDIHKWDAQNPQAACFWAHEWLIQDCSVTRTGVTFKLQSWWAILKKQAPRMIYSALCNWSTFDPQCGLVRASFEITYAVLTGSTKSQLLVTTPSTPQNQPDGGTLPNGLGYYTLGQAVCVTGPNVGQKRTIKSQAISGTTSTLVLFQDFLFDPEVGDTFTLVPGDDKTIQTCAGKFDNIVPAAGGGFGGMPDIPDPLVTNIF